MYEYVDYQKQRKCEGPLRLRAIASVPSIRVLGRCILIKSKRRQGSQSQELGARSLEALGLTRCNLEGWHQRW